MKNIILILFVAFLFSCKREEGGSPSSRDTGVFITYKNANNQDLLDPNTLNAIKAEDIDIFLLHNDGQKKQILDGNKDMQEGFKIVHSTNGNYMLLGMDPQVDAYNSQNKATFYIKYKDGTEDTLVGEYNADRNKYIRLLKVWVNGVLKYELGPSNTKPTSMIEIIK